MKIKSLLSVLMAAMAFTAMGAADEVIGDFRYYLTQFVGQEDQEAIIMGLREGYNPSGRLVIPDSVTHNGKTYAVVGVGMGGFSGHDTDEPAIGYCEGITSVYIPAGIRYVGDFEFMGCPNIESYTVAEGNEDYATLDGALLENFGYEEQRWMLFRYPSANTQPTYAVPASVERVAMGAFAANNHLKKVYLSGDQMFQGCWQLGNHTIESVDVSNNDNYRIGDDGGIYYGNTFVGVCPGVKYDVFTIHNSYCRYMGTGAFCEAQVREVVIPESMENYAGASAFRNSTVESIVCPNPIQKVQSNCFQNCNQLKSISLSCTENGALNIGSCAFAGCEALKEVNLDSAIKTIDISWSAFENCRSLESFPATKTMKITGIDTSAFAGCESMTTFSFVPVEALHDNPMGYQFAGTGLTSLNWPSSISKIPGGCFMDCKNLTKVSLKSTTRRLGDQAFARSGLTAISMMGVTFFYSSTFSGCEDLYRVYFPTGTEGAVSYDHIPLTHPDAQIVINNKNVANLYLQTKYWDSSNISLYMSAFNPGQELGTGWKRVCVPARAEQIYATLTEDELQPMYTYTTYKDEKAVEVVSAMPEVKIKGVVIEGVEAEYRNGRWYADEAEIADGRMNVTVNYTVNNNVMNTTYEYPYEASSVSEIVSEGGKPQIEVNQSELTFHSADRWNVYDMSGHILMTGSSLHLDLTQFAPGMYLVEAFNGKGKSIRKIML